MTAQDRMTIGGLVLLAVSIVGIAALTVALFDWLRDDMADMGADVVAPRDGQNELRKRLARMEDTVAGALTRPNLFAGDPAAATP